MLCRSSSSYLKAAAATRAIECGMDVKMLSEILGHKSPAITLNRYVHSFMDSKRKMMNKLGDAYLEDMCGAFNN